MHTIHLPFTPNGRAPASAAWALLRSLGNALPHQDRVAILKSASVCTLPLGRHATFWVDHPMTRQVTCQEGVVWLTFDGDLRDVVLEAGQMHLCQSDQRLAIHALEDGSVCIA